MDRLDEITIFDFQNKSLTVWNANAPVKKKVVRGNKAFMQRSKRRKRSLKLPSDENLKAFKQYRNFYVSLLRKEKNKFDNKLDISPFQSYHKNFWECVKPLRFLEKVNLEHE